MAEGTVVTFYSYKGGVGRTLALANIGALLTRWGYKVLCVDWDLEAPGLHLYFDRWIQKDTITGQPTLNSGLTELIHDYVDGKEPRWSEYLTDVQFPETTNPLKLMTAGKLDQAYVQRMQGLDWKRLYEEHNLGNFLEQLRSEWKKEFDFVLIDSRTGITDIGGICTVQLPDLMVLLFTANLQSLRGSLDVVSRAKEVRKSLPFDRAKLLVLPVASRFELRVEYELAQQWLKNFADELQDIYAEWLHKDVTVEELLNHTRVPHIPFWSFGEKLPVIDQGTDDPEDIGFSFDTLAALVAQRFSNSQVLVHNRDSYLASSRRTPKAIALKDIASNMLWSYKGALYAAEIRDRLALVKSHIEKGEVADDRIQRHIDRVKELLESIQERPVTPPLASDEGTTLVNLNSLAHEILRQLQQNDRYENIRIIQEIGKPDPLIVNVNPEWLRQAMGILIDNAVQAVRSISPTDTDRNIVTVSTAPNGKHAEFRVVDRGPGIPNDIRDQLFKGPTESTKGRGVGLLVAQAVAQTYGGQLEIARTDPTGTEMVIRLPQPV